jgi:hypothetical protein
MLAMSFLPFFGVVVNFVVTIGTMLPGRLRLRPPKEREIN